MATVWIDTSVSLEIETQGDLFRELDLIEHCQLRGSLARVEDRRMRAQGSWWMAMALCKQRATTVISEHENKNAMRRYLAEPGTDREVMSNALESMLFVNGLLEGWNRRMHPDGCHLSDRQMDLYMVEKAREHEMTLITRDVPVIEKKGPAGGVHPLTPEQYAAQYISWRDARDMFFERLGRAVTAYAAAAIHRRNRVSAGHVVLRRFEWIWVPRA